jgi:cell wall-associated NlpC family hydrolase
MAEPLLRPNPTHFQTGDLLWVKRDDQLVPMVDIKPSPESLAHAEAAKQQMLQLAEWTGAQRQEILQWQLPKPTDEIWVGHIGLVDMRQGQPWVIDATPDRHQPAMPGQAQPVNPSGVAAQSYDAWLQDTDHNRSQVWHGRVRQASAAQAQKMVDFALAQLGKAYSAWPWPFAKMDTFYCSELVWCAVRAGCGICLDDNASTWRVNWFTPAMALRSPHVQVLYAPPGRAYSLQDAPITP